MLKKIMQVLNSPNAHGIEVYLGTVLAMGLDVLRADLTSGTFHLPASVAIIAVPAGMLLITDIRSWLSSNGVDTSVPSGTITTPAAVTPVVPPAAPAAVVTPEPAAPAAPAVTEPAPAPTTPPAAA